MKNIHSAKNQQISTALAILLSSLLILANCGQKENSTAGENQKTSAKKSTVASSAQVTFVELGSVNCIPCRMMQPVMKEIDSMYAGKVKVVFIDVLTDEGKPYAQQFGIRAIPTQVFLDAQGKELARHIGFYPKDSIVALLASKGLK